MLIDFKKKLVSNETAVRMFIERKDVPMGDHESKPAFVNILYIYLQLLPLLFRLFREE